jgi:phosphoglycerate dehydrogenase-like enzyme
MAPTVVWVLASADDPGLPALSPAPEGVAFVVGNTVERFADAPRPDAILVCWVGRRVLEPVFALALARGLKWIHSRSAGIEKTVFPALAESDVVMTNGRGVFSVALAEFVIGSVLYFARGFPRLLRSQAAARWEEFDPEPVAGRTMGIVGYGDIGRATAVRARALDMRILALRRRPQESNGDPLVDEVLPPEALPELMRRADDVVVALPLTPETKGFVGAAAIAELRPSAVLVNVGRGPVLDEKTLVEALAARRIKGAALDVFDQEPLPADHPFWRMDNVLLSPHTADHTPGWLDDAMRAFLQNLERFRRGQPLASVVDKARGY